MLEGRPRFRAVGFDLELAREQRRAFMRVAQFGVLAATPRLTFGMVAGWWVERFERMIAAGSAGSARSSYTVTTSIATCFRPSSRD